VVLTIHETTANTTSVITSWITFNWIKIKGPPLPLNPILFSGTWNIYSNKAIPQLINMIEIKPSIWDQFHSENFKWPYQAMTINELLKTNSKMTHNAFIVVSECLW